MSLSMYIVATMYSTMEHTNWQPSESRTECHVPWGFLREGEAQKVPASSWGNTNESTISLSIVHFLNVACIECILEARIIILVLYILVIVLWIVARSDMGITLHMAKRGERQKDDWWGGRRREAVSIIRPQARHSREIPLLYDRRYPSCSIVIFTPEFGLSSLPPFSPFHAS